MPTRSRTEEIEIPYTIADRDCIRGIHKDVRALVELRSSHERRISRLERWRIRTVAVAGVAGAVFTLLGGWIVPEAAKEALKHWFFTRPA